jgi:hypothetical protein
MKYITKFTNQLGDIIYPIYLIAYGKNNENFILECEHEIYSMAYHTIYTNSIKDLQNGQLEVYTGLNKALK